MRTAKERKHYAKSLRKHQTPAERRLKWLWLLGFRAQVVTPCNFIADYYHKYSRIIVEVDGGVHAHQRAADRARDRIHWGKGIATIRVSNRLVLRYHAAAGVKIVVLSICYQCYFWFKI